MKKIIAFCGMLLALCAGATNITNYPVRTTFNANYWFLLSDVPNQTNWNLPGNYVASTADLNSASNALWQLTTNLVAAQTNFDTLYVTNLYVDTLTATNLYFTNLFAGEIDTTNLYVQYGWITNLYSDIAYITNLYTDSLTVTNLYVSNLFAGDITTTNLWVTSINGTTNPFVWTNNGTFTWLAGYTNPDISLYRTNPGPPFFFRDSDGSFFGGKHVAQDQSVTNTSYTYPLQFSHFTESNDAPILIMNSSVANNENYDQFAGILSWVSYTGARANWAISTFATNKYFNLRLQANDFDGYFIWCYTNNWANYGASAGNVFDVSNSGLVRAWEYEIWGTTNQLVFGATNAPPPTTTNQIDWVSVQVTGRTNEYRIPLYTSYNPSSTNILTAYIQDGWVTNLYSSSAWLTNLYTDRAWITNLYANNGWITNLYSDSAWITNLYANSGWITNLYTDKGYITNIFTQQVKYYTNQGTMAPDFSKGYDSISTNADFTFLAPINTDANLKFVETTVKKVTNTKGSPILASLPSNINAVPGSVWYITNVTWFTFVVYGNEQTNAYAVPIR